MEATHMKQRTKSNLKLRKVLAHNLRAYREREHLSQEKLAEMSDLHRTYIGSVERAERNVTLSTLSALAQALDISVPQLLTPGIFDDEA